MIPAWRYPGTPAQRRRLTLPARRRCWTRTTSASKRSRSASSSSSPCASSRRAVKGGVLCLVGPAGRGQDQHRPLASPAPLGRKLARVCRWAASTTRPRSAATGKTYIGAMPGRHHLRPSARPGSMNPVHGARRDRQDVGSDYARRPLRRPAGGPGRGAEPHASATTTWRCR